MVLPTRVGVNRHSARTWSATPSAPHACGGEPTASAIWPAVMTCSPRVGVNRLLQACRLGMESAPHACGGEPVVLVADDPIPAVLPTRVGVNRHRELCFPLG